MMLNISRSGLRSKDIDSSSSTISYLHHPFLSIFLMNILHTRAMELHRQPAHILNSFLTVFFSAFVFVCFLPVAVIPI
jgi:hypothetical protein